MSSLYDMVEKSGKHQRNLLKICEPLFMTFGINYFVHQSVSKDGHFNFVGTFPDFLHHYCNEKMYICNPFITRFDQLKSGIYLYDSVNDNNFQKTMDLAKEKYDLHHSIVIIEKDQNRCREWVFGVPKGRNHVQSLLINQQPLLKRFNQFFDEEMGSLIKETEKNPFDLVANCSFNAQKTKVAPEIQLEHFKRINFLSNIKVPKSMLSNPKLSKREIECLKCYVKGMSATEIADELLLSSRTIESYIENIKNKLSCYKKSELIHKLHYMEELGLF